VTASRQGSPCQPERRVIEVPELMRRWCGPLGELVRSRRSLRLAIDTAVALVRKRVHRVGPDPSLVEGGHAAAHRPGRRTSASAVTGTGPYLGATQANAIDCMPGAEQGSW
jgi:hypothetical protein